MTDIIAVLGTAGASILLLVLTLPAYIKLTRHRKRRLMRCPESGGITMVDIQPTDLLGHSTQGGPRLRVRQCRLWPERKDCGRGCLSRYSQGGNYGFNLASLRPFEDHEIKQHTSLPS
jgi:hypothetical protein